MCCGSSQAISSASTTAGDKSNTQKHLTTPPASPGRSCHKRSRLEKIPEYEPGPELPPLLFDVFAEAASPALPEFPTMPPISAIQSLAGSGCTCGLECACPGCAVHRGPEHASSSNHQECGDGACSDCVDSHAGIALPGYDDAATQSTNSILDRFFARAAALPAPPSHRKGNTTTISLPKLECCGGQCGCPDGGCACGTNCGGCCAEHMADDTSASSVAGPSTLPPPTPVAPPKSCCSSKAARL